MAAELAGAQASLLTADRRLGGVAKALIAAQCRLGQLEYNKPLALLGDLLDALEGATYTAKAATGLVKIMEAGSLSFRATPRVIHAVIEMLTGGQPLPQVGGTHVCMVFPDSS